MPAEGYRRFVELLHAEGIARDDFRVMRCENGDYLLHGGAEPARAEPCDLPVPKPTKYELVINQKRPGPSALGSRSPCSGTRIT